MRPERGDIGLARSRRYHHGDRIAGHDPEEDEYNDRDARESAERDKDAPEDGEGDHRSIIILRLAPDRDAEKQLTTNFLNNIQFTFTDTATNYLMADTNVFFANVPGILLPDETYNDIVFGIAINPTTPPGNYSGLVAIQGGTNIFDATSLSSQTFQVLLSPAALSAVLYGTNLLLSWPSPPGGFVLQQNAGLTTANWMAVTNVPANTNFQNQVILPPVNGNQFYRLRYP